MLEWLTSSRCLKKVKIPTTSEVPGLDFWPGNVQYVEQLAGTLALCSLPADALPTTPGQAPCPHSCTGKRGAAVKLLEWDMEISGCIASVLIVWVFWDGVRNGDEPQLGLCWVKGWDVGRGYEFLGCGAKSWLRALHGFRETNIYHRPLKPKGNDPWNSHLPPVWYPNVTVLLQVLMDKEQLMENYTVIQDYLNLLYLWIFSICLHAFVHLKRKFRHSLIHRDCFSSFSSLWFHLPNNNGHYLISIFNFIMSLVLQEKDVLFKHCNAFSISLVIS